MKSLQNQYNEINEGKGHKDMFLKSARRLFPEYITNFATYKEAVTILKQKSIISEAIGGVVSQPAFNPFQAFNTFINEEAKAIEKKPTTDVIEKETAGFDYKNRDNIDNVYGTSFLQGFYAEMQDPKNAEKSVDELKKIVAKNMAKDFNYYMKNAAFGVKGLGYQTSAEPKEPKGKWKSSGYGDLPRNTLKESIYESYDDMYGVDSEAENELIKNQRKYNQEIDWINNEVDYVPDNIEVYDSWPEPYRSKALRALEYRKKNFKQMSDYKRDSFKENLKENKLRSIINTIIREELKNESYDYETQADLRGMAKEESLAQAIKLAKSISREGVVQHVNQQEDGFYEVSDLYDSDSTMFSYENGIEI